MQRRCAARRTCEHRLPHSNGKGTLTRNLSESSPADPVWRWCNEGNRIRLIPRYRQPNTDEASYSFAPTRALIKSVTDDPVFLYPSVVSELPVLRRWSWLWATLVFLPAWALVYFWVKPTLSHMFLQKMRTTDVFPSFVLDENSPISRNLVLLSTETSTASQVLKSRWDVRVLDFAEVFRGGDIDFK